ncbi:Ubiquitin-conjugating enzyme E2 7 [Camellia lanceoleosa]|uniref:Ubiquitin-conjugating enzyme E2 7 n=1 Tax=Camellia lanceoleosa TaxID=1840588 RepID=A0ACC0FXZ0_9ERIC|nr:Ubiquitin-conjugating enzyme E2 7 [Camellia lanceoleosa]
MVESRSVTNMEPYNMLIGACLKAGNVEKAMGLWKQVESIVLSIISMLSSPNDESPANVEATVEVARVKSFDRFVD